MIKCVHSVVMRSVLPIESSVTVACVQLEDVLSRARMPAVELMLSRGVPCPPVFNPVIAYRNLVSVSSNAVQ